MNKVLSISIAAYNAENDIKRCLDSLLKCKCFDNLDIIVVNDGSKDGTKQVAEQYESKYPQSIRVVNKENGGHGSTINTSIKNAVGKYYKILDSDDWVSSDGLDHLVEFLNLHDVDMVLNQYEEVDYNDHSKKKLMDPNQDGIPNNVVHQVGELTKATVLFMHSLTFSTKVMQDMGSIIDEHCFYVDMEYCIFPLIHVKSFACLDFPVYEYLLGSATQSMNMQNLINRRDQHLKVTKRIISFYEEHSSTIIESIRDIIALRIKYAVYQQYLIYLHMKPKESKSEVVAFDHWLSAKPDEIYQGPQGHVMKYIKMNRGTHFFFYTLLTTIAQKVKII